MAEYIPTWDQYKAWWEKEVRLKRRSMPPNPEMWFRYKNLVKKRGGTLSVEDARQAEYEYTERLRPPVIIGGIEGLPYGGLRVEPDMDMVLVHMDGDPTNNDASNMVVMSAQQAHRQNRVLYNSKHEADGFTIAEAMKMNAKIVKVTFEAFVPEVVLSSFKTYEYLVDKDVDLKRNDVVIISRNDGEVKDMSTLGFATVVETVDLIDGAYDGKLKWIVGKVNMEVFNARIEKQKKRERLLKKATTMAEEKNTIEKLNKLIGDSEEGKKLLAEIAALDNE